MGISDYATEGKVMTKIKPSSEKCQLCNQQETLFYDDSSKESNWAKDMGFRGVWHSRCTNPDCYRNKVHRHIWDLGRRWASGRKGMDYCKKCGRVRVNGVIKE